MAYILVTEGCQGSRIKFIEQGGQLLQKPIGKKYSGPLILQEVENRNCKRIFFGGSSLLLGGIKKFFGLTKAVYDGDLINAYVKGNTDYTCLFEFSEEELRLGKKKITYSVQIVGFVPMCVLAWYDFKDHTGCCYMFSDDAEGRKWAKQLGLTEYEVLDADGNVKSKETL